MIVDHKWFCIKCNKAFNLAVEMNDPFDRQKLDTAFSQMTKHTLSDLDQIHEIIHKEKIRDFHIRDLGI